ncbi:MAG: hypothetical protein ABIO05_03575 [Ferruginibacter sp.]
MKLLLPFVLLLFYSSAQSQSRPTSCNDAAVLKSADSLLKLFDEHNYIALHKNSITMQSDYEVPIYVSLTKGERYVFAFVGDPTSRLFEYRIYDANDQRVAYEKQYATDREKNIIIFSHLADYTGYYLLRPVQINKQKKKDLCSFVMLFKQIGQEKNSRK